MSTPGQPPRGFCPHCHYPIDPGICPECGVDVPEGSLLFTLPESRSVRIRRWSVRAVLLGLLIGGSYYSYHNVNWYGYFPTSWLLKLQGNARHGATVELARRCKADELNDEQATAFFKRAIHVNPTIRTRSPYPKGCTLPIEIQFDFQTSATLGPWRLTNTHKTWFDGQRAGLYSESPIPPGKRTWTETIEDDLIVPGEPLVEAQFEMSLRHTLQPRSGAKPNAGDVRLVHEWEVWARQKVQVVDEPVDSFVQAIDNPRLRSEVEAAIEIQFVNENGKRHIRVNHKGVTSRVAGYLWVRECDAGDFTKYYSIRLEPFLPSVSWESMDYGVPYRLREKNCLDVRIVADPTIAVVSFDEKAKYYGGTIEQKGIKLTDVQTRYPASNNQFRSHP